jgi:hypothetical protein
MSVDENHSGKQRFSPNVSPATVKPQNDVVSVETVPDTWPKMEAISLVYLKRDRDDGTTHQLRKEYPRVCLR